MSVVPTLCLHRTKITIVGKAMINNYIAATELAPITMIIAMDEA